MPADDGEIQASVLRLGDLIQLLARTRPLVILEIERSAISIVTNDVRQQIAERLQRFSEEDVRIVEALTEHLDRRRDPKGYAPEA